MKRLKKGRFAEVFRIDKAILYVIVIDIMFYLSLAGSAYLLNLALFQNFTPLEDVYPIFEKLASMYEGTTEVYPGFGSELEAAEDIMRSVVINSVLIGIVFYILVVALISLFKGLIWAKISKQRFSFRFFRRFLLFNYLWISFWAVVFIGSFILFKENIRLYIIGFEFLFFIYSNSVIRALFNERGKFFGIIKKGIKGCFRVKILSLVYIIVGFIVFILISFLIFLMLQGIFYVIILLVIFTLYSALVRRYMFSITN